MWNWLVMLMKVLFGGKNPPPSAPLNPSAAKPSATTSAEDLAAQAVQKRRLEESTRMEAESERNQHANQASFQFQLLLNILEGKIKRYNPSLPGQDRSPLAMALTEHSDHYFEIKSGLRSVQFRLSSGRLEVNLQNRDTQTFALAQGRWTKTRTERYAGGEFQADRFVESKKAFDNQTIADVYLRYMAGLIDQVLSEFSV